MNTAIFIQKSKIKYGDNKFDYSDTLFVDKKNKLYIKCRDCLNQHFVYPDSHLRNTTKNCKFCSKRLDPNKFIEDCKSVHGNRYDYHKTIYTNSSNYIIVICRIYGEFHTIASNHKSGANCSKCAYEDLAKKYRHETSDTLKRAQAAHNNFYTYENVGEIKNLMTKVPITCPIHGIFEQSMNSHINFKSGCWKCGTSYPLTTEDFINASKKHHNDKYDYSSSEYINSHIKDIIEYRIPFRKISFRETEEIDVYNFSTENETYCVNGILTHNCSYPVNCPTPFKEKDLWNGSPETTNMPYGVAKRTLLMLSQTYREQYEIGGAFFLPANMMGPFDHFDLTNSHVVPALINKFVNAKTEGLPDVLCWGTGKVSREFLFAEDCCSAIMTAFDIDLNEVEPINVGTGKEIYISDLATLIAELVEYDGKIVFTGEVSDGQPRRCLNVSRAKKLLKWKAKTNLKAALKQTIDYYKSTKI